jgi:twinkle protein
MEREESSLVQHGPCDQCGSSDANALYDDGHAHCFSCGHHTAAVGEMPARSKRLSSDLLRGEPQALIKRGISEETCRKFSYWVGTMQGEKVQIACYRDGGEIIAQKVRTKDKDFTICGDAKRMGLFGQHLWKGQGRRIVVTEGEIDALSVAEATGRTWDVVSLPNGAQSARRVLQKHLEWLLGYETTVLAFDDDEPGREAVTAVADLFPPGRCAVASYEGFKDSNELLLAENGVKRLSQAMWQAKPYRPDGIVTLDDIRERVMSDPDTGLPYPFEGVTRLTYGRRLGEVIGLGGGTGCGKTDLFTTMIAYDLMKLGLTVGVIYLEQGVAETGKRIAGKAAGKLLHVPGKATPEERQAALDKLPRDRLFLYDNFGAMDWETIQARIRYMVQANGCQTIYLDHLTALAAAADDERKELEKVMAELASLAKALNVVIHYVSHLATPDGKPHEENGRVMLRHFKGSRAIGFWTHFVFGLERDTQQPGLPTTLRCLKDRFTGDANGARWGLKYDRETGLLSECELDEQGDFGFTDDGSTEHNDF